MARAHIDPERLEACDRLFDRLLGCRLGNAPACSFEQRQPLRLLGRWGPVGPEQPRIAGIAAGAHGDLVRHLPGVLQVCRQDAGAALAQTVMTAAAVERPEGGLEAEAAAEARRPDG